MYGPELSSMIKVWSPYDQCWPSDMEMKTRKKLEVGSIHNSLNASDNRDFRCHLLVTPLFAKVIFYKIFTIKLFSPEKGQEYY